MSVIEKKGIAIIRLLLINVFLSMLDQVRSYSWKQERPYFFL
jgi:hypothetical protein